jgi:hypothetical protein
MKPHTYHSKPFNHRYLLVCILSGLYFQPAWATPHSVTVMTRSVTGHAPTAAPVLNNTSPVAGQTLTVNPHFSDADGDAMSDAYTLYVWQVQDSPGGTWRNIADAKPGSDPSSKKYIVWSGFTDKPLRVGVRPGGDISVVDPHLGEWAYSSPTNPVRGRAPEAKNVSMSGTPIVGNTLTGSYTYYDADGEAEGGTTYQWYMEGHRIPNATNKTYTIVAADQGKTLAFNVTPKSSAGNPNTGREVGATPVIQQGHRPVAGNVNIQHIPLGHSTNVIRLGDTLELHYTYNDADGDEESGSIYKWFSNGVEIQSARGKREYTITTPDASASLSVSVLPVSKTGYPEKNGAEVTSAQVVTSKWYKTQTTGDFNRAWSYCSSLGYTPPSILEATSLALDPKTKAWMTSTNYDWIVTSEVVTDTDKVWHVNKHNGSKKQDKQSTPATIVCKKGWSQTR